MLRGKNIQFNTYVFTMAIVIVFVVILAWPGDLFFLNDDFIHIPQSAKKNFGQNNSARHIGDFSIWIDSLFSDKNPAGYHLTNLVIHLLNGLLIPLFFEQTGKFFGIKLSRFAGIAVAMLFLVYPFHSEGLFWIIGRSVSLSTLTFLLTWVCFTFSNQNKLAYWGTFVLFIAGLFTYEQIWFLPVYAFFAIWLPKKELKWKNHHFKVVIILLAILILYMPLRLMLISEILNPYEAKNLFNLDFVKLTLNHVKLSLRTFTNFQSSTISFILIGSAGAIVLLLISILLYHKKRINRFWLFFLLSWQISLLPFISLGISSSGYASDRFLYLPSLFFCCWIIYTLVLLFKNKISLELSFFVLFLYFSFLFTRSGLDYRKAGNLAKSTLTAICNSTQNPIHIDVLPLSYQGIPVLRYGVAEAIQWTCPEKAHQELNFEVEREYQR